MGRMINIDELWKELEILYDAKNGEVAWNDALWKIKSAPVVESNAQQWIPCSERLPSEGENVLLCDARFGNVAIGRLIRYNTGCCWEVDHWDCDIEDWQAWKPLPEPWKGEQS